MLLKCVYLYFSVLIFTFTQYLSNSEALRLQKTWNSGDFYNFLAKFGVQKTSDKDLSNTEGFIYGNITTSGRKNTSVTLVVVDSEYFLEFFTNSSSVHSKSCEFMFQKINTIAFDPICTPKGKEDFLRRVPCPEGDLCVDEDTPSNVLSGYQFTYKVQDFHAPRYNYYISMLQGTIIFMLVAGAY